MTGGCSGGRSHSQCDIVRTHRRSGSFFKFDCVVSWKRAEVRSNNCHQRIGSSGGRIEKANAWTSWFRDLQARQCSLALLAGLSPNARGSAIGKIERGQCPVVVKAWGPAERSDEDVIR